MDINLKNKMVAILVAPKFQDDETTSPQKYLTALGAETKYIGLQRGNCQGKGQTVVIVDSIINEVHSNEFDGLIIPGGSAPETLRQSKEVLNFVKAFSAEAKPIGVICHGPQVLISAQITAGRKMTCYPGIKDDLENSGAGYLDQEVVVDGNLVSSRYPQDLPIFNKAFADLVSKFDKEMTPWIFANPPQILEYAIMNEIKAQALYENLAKNVKDKLAKAKFKFLAETERSHNEALTEIFKQLTSGKAPTPRNMGDVGEATIIIQNDKDLLKILQKAISSEESAFRLYNQISGKLINPESRKIFQTLAEEELQHKALLEAEYTIKVGRPLPAAIEKEPWWAQETW